MTIAYWCVFITIIFPYFFTVLAKISPDYNNSLPRDYLQNTVGWRKRAYYVQLNSFEALPAFGFAVIIAHLAHAAQGSLDLLASIFVIVRIIYALSYLANKATLRSLIWGIGMACVIGIFSLSIHF